MVVEDVPYLPRLKVKLVRALTRCIVICRRTKMRLAANALCHKHLGVVFLRILAREGVDYQRRNTCFCLRFGLSRSTNHDQHYIPLIEEMSSHVSRKYGQMGCGITE